MTLYAADAASAVTSSAVDVASASAWHSASAQEMALGLSHAILAMPLCAAGRLRCGLGLALDLGLGPRLRALPVDAAVTLSSVDAASAGGLGVRR